MDNNINNLINIRTIGNSPNFFTYLTDEYYQALLSINVVQSIDDILQILNERYSNKKKYPE